MVCSKRRELIVPFPDAQHSDLDDGEDRAGEACDFGLAAHLDRSQGFGRKD